MIIGRATACGNTRQEIDGARTARPRCVTESTVLKSASSSKFAPFSSASFREDTWRNDGIGYQMELRVHFHASAVLTPGKEPESDPMR
jgi:hypothetical protein